MERQTSCKNFKSYFQTEYFACACVFPSDIYYQKTIAKQVYSLCPPHGRMAENPFISFLIMFSVSADEAFP